MAKQFVRDRAGNEIYLTDERRQPINQNLREAAVTYGDDIQYSSGLSFRNLPQVNPTRIILQTWKKGLTMSLWSSNSSSLLMACKIILS